MVTVYPMVKKWVEQPKPTAYPIGTDPLIRSG